MTRRGMTPGALTVAALSVVLVLTAGCASAPPERMRRALDASMERVLRTEAYLRSVAGISSHPSRLTRSDGFVYLADVAPILRYLAEVRDTARFRDLRAFTTGKMMRRGPAGFEVSHRYREGEPFQAATPYGYAWTTQALAEGWRLLGDTVSASVLAQFAPQEPASVRNPTELSQLSLACRDATDAVAVDPALARAVLRRARTQGGSARAGREQVAAGEGDDDLLSCLTRVGLAVEDPDATVRYLDRLLDRLAPLVANSGRPDMGTAADILLTLRRVREAGPEYAR